MGLLPMQFDVNVTEMFLMYVLMLQDDFKAMVNRPPGYYTAEQVAAKINATIATGHPLSRASKLYITGAHDAAAAAQF